jgi:hypothetical protein
MGIAQVWARRKNRLGLSPENSRHFRARLVGEIWNLQGRENQDVKGGEARGSQGCGANACLPDPSHLLKP